MNLAAIPTLGAYVSTNLAGGGLSPTERAVLENLRWEERVSDERLAHYAQGFADKDISQIDHVKVAHAQYAEAFLEIDVAETGIPDTFGAANLANRWPHIEENLYLLRIEGYRC
jgi:hypothetical protein